MSKLSKLPLLTISYKNASFHGGNCQCILDLVFSDSLTWNKYRHKKFGQFTSPNSNQFKAKRQARPHF